jgi:separase
MEILKQLETRDIFLYFGHGGGEQYASIHKIQKLSSCAAALLMGCSSGKIHDAGNFNSWGTSVSYLQAGSAAVVASLWDVTDKDLDRFSKEMLGQWGLLKENDVAKSLTEAVAIARDSCYLKYLVGAANVVYGCPVILQRSKLSMPNDQGELRI